MIRRFQNILCVMTPDSGETILGRAAKLAENHQARLTALEVIDDIPPDTAAYSRALWPEDFRQRITVTRQERLREEIASRTSEIPVRVRVLIGTPFLEIIREVLRHEHDLVIKQAESGGLLNRMFGSDDMHLLRKCPCPLYLVKPGAPENYRRIVAAVDVDDAYPARERRTRHLLNVQILELASSLVLSEFAELHIVYAWEDIAEKTMRYPFLGIPEERIMAHAEALRRQHEHHLEQLVNETLGERGERVRNYLRPQTHLLKGSPRREIPRFAAEIDAELVVMGTVARTGIPGLLMGNTAETILNQLDCSILAVKPPGFETPITLESG